MSREDFHLVKKAEVGFPKKVLVCPLYSGTFRSGKNKGKLYLIGRSGLITYSIVENTTKAFTSKSGSIPTHLLSIQQSSALPPKGTRANAKKRDDYDI